MANEEQGKPKQRRCRCTIAMRLIDGEWRCPANCPAEYRNRVDHRTSRPRTLASRSNAGAPKLI